MAEVWEIMVAMTFPVDPEDLKVRYEGDAEVDFADRAFSRVQPDLNSIVGPDKPFSGYIVLTESGQVARRCSG